MGPAVWYPSTQLLPSKEMDLSRMTIPLDQYNLGVRSVPQAIRAGDIILMPPFAMDFVTLCGSAANADLENLISTCNDQLSAGMFASSTSAFKFANIAVQITKLWGQGPILVSATCVICGEVE